MFTRFRNLLLVLLPILLVACASTSELPAGSEITLRVENDLIPPTTLTIHAVTETGSRRLVGVVRPSQTTTLNFAEVGTSQYRFVAETTTGNEIISNTITLGAGDEAIWSMNSNVLIPA